MTTLLSRAALAAAAMALGLSGANATTYNNSTTGNLTVNLVISSSCAVAPSTIDFGPQSAVTNSVANAQSSILVTCSNGTPYSVTLGQGLHTIGLKNRVMAGTGGNSLPYDLYTDTPGGTSWSGGTAITRTGSGVAKFHPCFRPGNHRRRRSRHL